MRTEYFVRLNIDTDLKTIEGLEEVTNSGKYKSANAMLIRCIEFGLPMLYSEAFKFAANKTPKSDGELGEVLPLLKGIANGIEAISLNSELAERLLSLVYNTTVKENDYNDIEQMKLSQLPERYVTIKQRAIGENNGR
jgi:hypothetical protein